MSNHKEKGGNRSERKPWMISIRFAFTSLTTLFLSISGLFIILFSYQGSHSAILEVTRRLMTGLSNDISRQTESYFSASLKALKNFENGAHNLDLFEKIIDRDTILEYLATITETHQEISAIYFGEQATGNFYMAKRMPNNTISKRTVTQTSNSIIVRWEHTTPTEYIVQFPQTKIFTLEQGYDPRKRSWYEAAINTNGFIWTDPYIFASDSSVGISVAKKLYLNSQERPKDLVGVMAVDFGLNKISTFLEEIDILAKNEITPSKGTSNLQKDYYIFLMSQDNSLLATSDKNTLAFKTFNDENTKRYALFTIENTPNKLIATSFNKFQANVDKTFSDINLYEIVKSIIRFGNTQTSDKTASGILKVVNFTFTEEDYLATLNEFSPSSGINFKVGIVFKETLVTGPVTQALNLILLISTVLIILIIIVSLRILNNITDPIVDLAKDMNKVRAFEFDIDSQLNKKQNFLREINNMNSSYNSMKSGLNSFKKFVPSEVVAQLVKLGKEAHVSGEKLDISIFFSDIHKFTVISEETPSEQLIAQLRYYLNVLSNGIAEKKGTLDKYIGDSIMAFWGAPAVDKDHALNSCSAAIHCQKLSLKINEKFEKAGLYPMHTRMGIHTGPAIVGNIGSDVRLNYTAIGDSVNLSSRLEGLNKLYNTKIIISEETYNRTREVLLSRLLDKVAVYGKKNSIAAYELVDYIDNVSIQDKEFYNLFNEGTNFYFSKNWNKAIKIFKACLIQRENDGPSRVLLERCLYYSKKSINMEEWDGVFTAVSK